MTPRIEQAIFHVRHLRTEGYAIWADGQGDIHVMPPTLTPEDQRLIGEEKIVVAVWLELEKAVAPPDAEVQAQGEHRL